MNLRHVIVDYRVPNEVIESLQIKGKSVHLFSAKGLTYEAVDGHPDIFMHQSGDNLVIAPNTPAATVKFLNEVGVNYILGSSNIGFDLRTTTQYNSIATSELFFHKYGFSDLVISHLHKQKKFIQLPQAYTRCSMFCIANNCVITSDQGIHRVLKEQKFNSYCLSADEIVLQPYKNGFLGGCVGMENGVVYFCGSLKYLKDGSGLRRFVEKAGLKIEELYDGPLLDVGGLFFV